MATCQYPDAKSSVEKYLLPFKASRHSSIRGKGYTSFIVASFSLRKSMQNLRVPSFFLTKRIGDPQGDFEGRIWPPSSILVTSSSTYSFSLRDFRNTLLLMGSASPVLMMFNYMGIAYFSIRTDKDVFKLMNQHLNSL